MAPAAGAQGLTVMCQPVPLTLTTDGTPRGSHLSHALLGQRTAASVCGSVCLPDPELRAADPCPGPQVSRHRARGNLGECAPARRLLPPSVPQARPP